MALIVGWSQTKSTAVTGKDKSAHISQLSFRLFHSISNKAHHSDTLLEHALFCLHGDHLHGDHLHGSPSFWPWMTLRTPSGTPASCAIFTSIMQAPGSCSLGFTTKVLPHTRARGNICVRVCVCVCVCVCECKCECECECVSVSVCV